MNIITSNTASNSDVTLFYFFLPRAILMQPNHYYDYRKTLCTVISLHGTIQYNISNIYFELYSIIALI